LLATQAIACRTEEGGKTLEKRAGKENPPSVGEDHISNLTESKWSTKDVLCLEGLIKHMNQHEISFVGLISSPFRVTSPENPAFLSVHLSNIQLYWPFGSSDANGNGVVQGISLQPDRLQFWKKNLDITNPFFLKVQGINSNFLLYL
jgi:hypothetical protein